MGASHSQCLFSDPVCWAPLSAGFRGGQPIGREDSTDLLCSGARAGLGAQDLWVLHAKGQLDPLTIDTITAVFGVAVAAVGILTFIANSWRKRVFLKVSDWSLSLDDEDHIEPTNRPWGALFAIKNENDRPVCVTRLCTISYEWQEYRGASRASTLPEAVPFIESRIIQS